MCGSVLPQMQKHSTKTKILIPFLAHIADSSSKELSEEEAVSQGAASKDKKALRDTVNKMIDTLIPAVTSALRLSDFHPKKKEPEPYWNDCRFRELPKDKDTAFAKQVADLYCYCHTTGRNKDADLILAWLLTEAETASTTIFPAFIVPFLPAFRVALNKSGIQISKAEQTVSQHMVAEFLNRCVGSEPSKPTAWILSPLGPCYRPPDCKLCPELDRFLQDPLQEEREFKEINIHFHQRVSKRCYSDFAHQITKDESGREILRVTKNDKVHEEWEKRLNEVGGRMKWFRRCETLLGDRYEELMDMRAVKLTTASRNLKMKAP